MVSDILIVVLVLVIELTKTAVALHCCGFSQPATVFHKRKKKQKRKTTIGILYLFISIIITVYWFNFFPLKILLSLRVE
ncbi:MAG TPA: hypothetical protein VEA37_14930, partial [Flavobacterium sp.]|nr:hypothetical protein [Flavobacterium sp.]